MALSADGAQGKQEVVGGREVVGGIYTRLGIEWKMLKSVGERVEIPSARARVKFSADAPR